jgi:hypothetical protein
MGTMLPRHVLAITPVVTCFSLRAAYDSCWLRILIKFSLRLANTQLDDTLSKMFEKFMKHTAGKETRLACHTSVMVGWKILTMI